jgi:hypothetical protein
VIRWNQKKEIFGVDLIRTQGDNCKKVVRNPKSNTLHRERKVEQLSLMKKKRFTNDIERKSKAYLFDVKMIFQV